jgi:hypothetical protein
MLCKDTFTHILLRPREKKSRIIESHFYLMTDVMVVGVERGKKYFLSAVLPLEHCATEIVDTKIDSTCVGMCAHPRLTNSRHSLPIILFDGLAFTHSLTLSPISLSACAYTVVVFRTRCRACSKDLPYRYRVDLGREWLPDHIPESRRAGALVPTSQPGHCRCLCCQYV